MNLKDAREGDLFTHAKTGGLYVRHGSAIGTEGELIIFSSYFTGQAQYLTAKEFDAEMLPLEAWGLRFARLWPVGRAFAVICWLFGLSLPALLGNREAYPLVEPIGAVSIMMLVFFILRYPITWLYKWKYDANNRLLALTRKD